MSGKTCGDCEFYTPVDCLKGWCRGKKSVMLDMDASQCQWYRSAKLCKFCSLYVPVEEFIGNCSMSKIRTFPDRPAWNCQSFQFSEPNLQSK